MIVKLIELVAYHSFNSHTGPESSYTLKEVFVNPEQIICLRADPLTDSKLQAGLLPENLDQRQKFTTVCLNKGSDITVVGDPASIKEKLNIETRTLLKG